MSVGRKGSITHVCWVICETGSPPCTDKGVGVEVQFESGNGTLWGTEKRVGEESSFVFFGEVHDVADDIECSLAKCWMVRSGGVNVDVSVLSNVNGSISNNTDIQGWITVFRELHAGDIGT